jgi:hypothetical protein
LFLHILAALDGAYSEKEEADFSAMTVWGVYLNASGQRKIMLVHAWQKRLPFSADRSLIEWLPDEINDAFHGRTRWRQRTQRHFGLVEWVDLSWMAMTAPIPGIIRRG